jgi:hypothetical protein
LVDIKVGSADIDEVQFKPVGRNSCRCGGISVARSESMAKREVNPDPGGAAASAASTAAFSATCFNDACATKRPDSADDIHGAPPVEITADGSFEPAVQF